MISRARGATSPLVGHQVEPGSFRDDRKLDRALRRPRGRGDEAAEDRLVPVVGHRVLASGGGDGVAEKLSARTPSGSQITEPGVGPWRPGQCVRAPDSIRRVAVIGQPRIGHRIRHSPESSKLELAADREGLAPCNLPGSTDFEEIATVITFLAETTSASSVRGGPVPSDTLP